MQVHRGLLGLAIAIVLATGACSSNGGSSTELAETSDIVATHAPRGLIEHFSATNELPVVSPPSPDKRDTSGITEYPLQNQDSLVLGTGLGIGDTDPTYVWTAAWEASGEAFQLGLLETSAAPYQSNSQPVASYNMLWALMAFVGDKTYMTGVALFPQSGMQSQVLELDQNGNRLQLFDVPIQDGADISYAQPIVVGPDNRPWILDTASGWVLRITEGGAFEQVIQVGGGNGVLLGRSGDVWYLSYTGSEIGKISAAGVVTATYPIPENLIFVWSPSPGQYEFFTCGPTIDAEGNLWFCGADTKTDKEHNIIRFDPTQSGADQFRVYPQSDGAPSVLMAANTGDLWGTYPDAESGAIGRISKANPSNVDILPLPTLDSNPFELAEAPDGKIWVLEAAARQVAVVDPDALSDAATRDW